MEINKQFTNGVLATLSVLIVTALLVGFGSWVMELESIGYILWFVFYKPIFTVLDVFVGLFFIGVFVLLRGANSW